METAAAVEIQQGRLRRNFLGDFHRCLKKSSQKTLRLFHSYHRPGDGGYDNNINFSKRLRSTLNKPVFGPKNGEPLRLGLWLEIILKLIAFGILAEAIGHSVIWAAEKGKSRNETIEAIMAGLLGLLSFAIALMVGGTNPDYNVSTVGPLMGITMFLVIVLGPAFVRLEQERRPYCESHSVRMVSKVAHKVPLSSEEVLLGALKTRNFVGLRDLVAWYLKENYCVVTLDWCPQCKHGYISMETNLTVKQKRTDGTEQTSSMKRLVFSSSATEAEIMALQ